MNPLRILCLHGRYQNGNVFRQKIASITEACIDYPIIFDFLDAPFQDVPPVFRNGLTGHYKVSRTQLRDPRYLAWWPGKNRENFDHIHSTLVDYLKLHDCQQYDGVLGFSQGAALATVLCTEQMAKELDWSPRFSIFFCGNLPLLIFPKEYTSNFLSHLPSLHVMGMQDQIIPCQSSLQVYHEMKKTSPTIKYVIHPNGHVIPTDPASIHTVTDFILHQCQQ